MTPILRNILKRIFTSGEFESTIGEELATKGDPLFGFFGKEIPQKLLDVVDRSLYTTAGSIGKGRRLHSYWFAIFDRRITTSASKGVYVVYLLSYDGKRLYLTLNQGSDGDSAVGLIEIRRRASILSNALTNIGNFAVGPVFIESEAMGRTKNFSEGSIFSKVYTKDSGIPSEESLRNDLENMLQIYSEYAEQNGYGSGSVVGEKENTELKEKDRFERNAHMQKIFFGAPGTGKSHKIDNGLFKNEDGSTYGLKSVSQDRKFRTTFHPDYDYAQFVGSYKPKKEGSSITYSFVPQVFAKAYVAAWNKFIAAGKKSTADNQVYLIIEEINRGNCAQVFGDLFQLLDRDENGYSSYEINADADFAEWIEKQLDSSAAPQNDIPDGIRSGCKLRLPPNFNILATMNTSDQSLFPMDSAFKRRFDWEYVPIDYEKIEANFDIAIGDKRYKWLTFIKNVNDKILDLTESEDKQLGEFFIKPAPGDGDVISKERFLGKVMFYLWNEVCKDEHRNGSFFRIKDQNPNREDFFTYQDLYKVGGDSTLIAFMNWIVPSDESTTDA